LFVVGAVIGLGALALAAVLSGITLNIEMWKRRLGVFSTSLGEVI
jgi:hypothetical protein